MIARVIPWFEDEEPRDLRRWALAALIVLGIHCVAIGGYVYIPRPEEITDNTIPFVMDPVGEDDVDQAPIAPAPEQQTEDEKPQPPPPPCPSGPPLPFAGSARTM